MNGFFKNKKMQLLLVFLLFFGLMAFFQFSTPNLRDTDPYYHIKQAYLIRTEGLNVVWNFPWLQFTIFKDQPADLSFLFHILLIPFTFGDLFFGAKLAISFFGSLIFVTIFYILKEKNIKHSFLWTLLLFVGCTGFIFRINLLRPHVLSISFVLLSIHFFLQKKYLALFLTCFIFILFYSGWEAIFLSLIVYLIIQKMAKLKVDLKLLGSCLAGFGLGILVHPNFPNILYAMWVQNFLVVWHRLKNTFTIGAEMYPPDFIKFSLFSAVPLLLFSFCFVLLLVHCFIQKDWKLKNKKIQEIFLLGILSLVSFILIGQFQRLLEYWVPWAVLFSALTFNYMGSLKRKAFVLIPAFVLAAFFVSLSTGLAYAYLKYPHYSETYKQVALKLKELTPQKSIIFHTDWSVFPKLFFWNHDNFYILGMDPTFMYVYNGKLYQKWNSIALSKDLDNAARIIKEDFRSEYILVTARERELIEKLDKKKDFQIIYQDTEAKIYKIAQ